MISQLSLFTLLIIGGTIAGTLFILKSFSLPRNFYRNQAELQELLKRKIWIEEREKEIHREGEDEGRENEVSSDTEGDIREI
jgi:hypothetical protein